MKFSKISFIQQIRSHPNKNEFQSVLEWLAVQGFVNFSQDEEIVLKTVFDEVSPLSLGVMSEEGAEPKNKDYRND
jgi:hypothetical protein